MFKRNKIRLLIIGIITITLLGYFIYKGKQVSNLKEIITNNNIQFETVISSKENISEDDIANISQQYSQKVDDMQIRGISDLKVNIKPTVDSVYKDGKYIKYKTSVIYRVNIFGVDLNRTFDTSYRIVKIRS